MDVVSVGGARLERATAIGFVHRYLNSPAEHWAYPGYDGYPGGPTADVSEQDLLGPSLLNAGLRRVRSFDEFRDVLPSINQRLRKIPTAAALSDADVDLPAIADVLGIVGDPGIYRVGLTTYSKVLHRKRPAAIPLYDEHVRRCYQEIGDAPVPRQKGRSWRDFAFAWIQAVRGDLTSQLDFWQELARLTPTGGPAITPLRALDIVAWELGRPGRESSPAEPPSDESGPLD